MLVVLTILCYVIKNETNIMNFIMKTMFLKTVFVLYNIKKTHNLNKL